MMSEIVALLKNLIQTPSFSKEEKSTADIIEHFLIRRGISVQRIKNNVIAFGKFSDTNKPWMLLNSHHDTVRPNASWTKDPFDPQVEQGRLYGLGSNDAGGALVSLLATFLHYYDVETQYNLCFVASAEEEISGAAGIELALKDLPNFALGIVGEPTKMQMAIAEKGLMVLDCEARGRSGHAAREEGVNAIYKALDDIRWIKDFRFPEESATLGPVKMSVTVVQAGRQHNVVPDSCRFTIDVRSTDRYSNDDILAILKQHMAAEITPRSTRLQPSGIDPQHPVVLSAQRMGLHCYGSPTCSDQALMPFPTVKIGPGDSARSHTADEYICLEELEEAIDIYQKLLSPLLF
jgi:acetylornithine deacetylase